MPSWIERVFEELRGPRWGVSDQLAAFHGLRPLRGLARGYVRVALRAG